MRVRTFVHIWANWFRDWTKLEMPIWIQLIIHKWDEIWIDSGLIMGTLHDACVQGTACLSSFVCVFNFWVNLWPPVNVSLMERPRFTELLCSAYARVLSLLSLPPLPSVLSLWHPAPSDDAGTAEEKRKRERESDIVNSTDSRIEEILLNE